jgi:hypothetical protein
MFCPKCGSNQGDGKKFCTGCGTNLLVVSQALTGQLTPPQPVIHNLPPVIHQPVNPAVNYDRHHEARKGITLAMLGGGFLIYKIVSFLFFAPFNGWRSPFGFSSFIAFILLAVGISKIVSSRVIPEVQSAASNFVAPAQPPTPPQPSLPQPVFSAATPIHPNAPRTNELDPVQPTISVTEDETKHLVR